MQLARSAALKLLHDNMPISDGGRILCALHARCGMRQENRNTPRTGSQQNMMEDPMKIVTSCVVSGIALAGMGAASAADADKGLTSRVYTDIVSPSEQVAYEAGAKAFNKCLADHGSKYRWNAWVHETGDTYKYSYVAGPYAWADFDKMAEIGKVCDQTWRKEANPHLKSETSAFLVAMPELSRMPDDKKAAPPALLSVTYFNLKPGREADDAFNDNVKKIAAAAEKAKWSYHFVTYKVRGGDKGAPDYILVGSYKNWADYGAGPDPGVWKMVEGVSGKAEADAMRKAIGDAIADASSHVNSYSAELSYVPAASK